LSLYYIDGGPKKEVELLLYMENFAGGFMHGSKKANAAKGIE